MIRCPACKARLRWFLHAYTQWSVTTEAGSTVHGATDELTCKACGPGSSAARVGARA